MLRKVDSGDRCTLALMGDAVDNIPGIKGVGEKSRRMKLIIRNTAAWKE